MLKQRVSVLLLVSCPASSSSKMLSETWLSVSLQAAQASKRHSGANNSSSSHMSLPGMSQHAAIRRGGGRVEHTLNCTGLVRV